jgi:phage gp16-like protein
MSAAADSPPRTALAERARLAAMRAVQVGRRTLAIDEDDWRALCERVTGERSTRAMSGTALAELRKELERLGWTPEAHGGGGRWRPKAKQPHQRKVYALWGELKRRGLWRVSSVDSLRQFVIRTTGGGAQAVEWLTPEQANKVIEAMKAIAARAGENLA